MPEQREHTRPPDDSPSDDQTGTQEPNRKPRILLVEDSPMNRQVALHILKRKVGGVADTASNGAEAIQALKTKRYDLVIMDCQMPKMDGYQATLVIRNPDSDVLDHDVSIIALTANSMKGDREKCLTAGMNDYVAKPVKPAELASAVIRNLPAGLCIQAIDSELADDPDLADILNDFVLGLPDQLARMREALADKRFDDLRRIAHQLKGAGGGYGYPALTESARGLENAAQAECSENALLSLSQLSTLCYAVQAGHEASVAKRENQK